MLQPGDKAPDFSLDTLDGQRFTLSATLATGQNWVDCPAAIT